MSTVHLDWNVNGLKYALSNHNIVILVDTLRFSSTVVTAVANDFTIFPVSSDNQGLELSQKFKAHFSGYAGEQGQSNNLKFSLSPLSFIKNKNEKNKSVVLFSTNGATLCQLTQFQDIVLIGSFLNAQSVAQMAMKISKSYNNNITIVACGEERPIVNNGVITFSKDTERVFAIEDYLAAGAILSFMDITKTPDAQVCQTAFVGNQGKIKTLLSKSISGQYLTQKGDMGDIDQAAKLNLYFVVPQVINHDEHISILNHPQVI